MKWNVNQSTLKNDQPVINDGMCSLCGVRGDVVVVSGVGFDDAAIVAK